MQIYIWVIIYNSFSEVIFIQINFEFYGLNPKNKNEIKIYNMLGEIVKTVVIKENLNKINSELKSGVYFCGLFVNGKQLKSEKLVVLK